MPSSREPFAKIHDGKLFINRHKSNVIESIIENNHDRLSQYIDDHGERLGEQICNKYKKYRDLYDEDGTPHMKEMEMDIMATNQKSNAIPYLVESIHCNQKLPDYHNVYIKHAWDSI